VLSRLDLPSHHAAKIYPRMTILSPLARLVQ
jgi:hypothetical protein